MGMGRVDSSAGQAHRPALPGFGGSAVIVTDVAGRITAWDYGAERLYGWTREEVLGRPIAEVVVPEEVAAEAEKIMADLANPASAGWEGRFRVRRKDGNVLEVLVQDTPIVVDGKVVAIVGQSAPVSQLRSLDADLAALQPGTGVAAILEARDQWLESFRAAARSAMSMPDLEALLRDVLATACNSLEADAASLLVTADDGSALVARAAFGWEAELFRPVRIPAGAGVSGKVLATKERVIIDELDDVEVFSPELRRSGFHSYVGVPLIQRERVVGVLHATSLQPGWFGEGDASTLARLAGPLASAVERVRQFVALAGLVSPTVVKSLDGLEVHSAIRNADGPSGGGDWYDMIQRDDGTSAVVIGDAGGHGVEALVSAGAARHALVAYLYEGHSPAQALSRLQALMAVSSFGAQADFVTVQACVYEPASRKLHIASAGHPPLLQLQDGTAVYGPPAGLPISSALPPVAYEQHTLQLHPGGIVILYTDGVIEVRGESIEEGLHRLRTTAVAHQHRPLDELCHTLLGVNHQTEPLDDRTMIILRSI